VQKGVEPEIMALFGKKGPDFSYKGKYLGGHSAYPKDMDINLMLNPDYLEIPEFPAMIPYDKITNVQSMSQDKLTKTRLLLTGVFAFAWKKKQMFMVLTYEDDIGIVQNPVFSVNKINEVQPTIYQRMMNARMMQKRAQQQQNGN
jgi:hypothetical protein